MDMLEVKNLSVKVEGKLILKDMTFNLKEGASHILFGPNGSGKTTLVSTLMGMPGYEVVSGKILFQGVDITNKGVEERAKLGMIVSFQNPPEIPVGRHRLIDGSITGHPVDCRSNYLSLFQGDCPLARHGSRLV